MKWVNLERVIPFISAIYTCSYVVYSLKKKKNIRPHYVYIVMHVIAWQMSIMYARIEIHFILAWIEN